MNVQSLPAVFTSFNLISFIFIMTAYIFIKMQNKKMHGVFMTLALISSSLFLAVYLTYHFNISEPRKYQGTGLLRYIYFTILITHTILAAVILPMIGTTVYHVLRKNFNKHKRIARWTLPIWIYVSVTGVIIYVMLYGL